MSPGRHDKIEIERIKDVLMMKILLKILVAPFALALSLLTALLVFLLDSCAFRSGAVPSDGSAGVSA